MLEKTVAQGFVVIEIKDSVTGEIKLHQTQPNKITNQGVGYLADLMANTPTKTKFNTANTYIVVGTGYGNVSVPAAQTWVYTQTGSPAPMQSGYPQTQSAFPSPTIVYSALFTAGTLNVTGINEACLVNNPISGGGVSLAYAQINPQINVSSVDTLTITWNVTFTSA
jgi:hypothetical protein